MVIGFNSPTYLLVDKKWVDVSAVYINFDCFEKCYVAAQIVLMELNGTSKIDLNYLAVRHFVQKIERGNMPTHISSETINKHVADLIAEAIKGDEVEILTKVEDTDDNRNIWDLLTEEKVEKLRQSQPPHVFIKIMERLLKEAVREYRG